MVTSCTEWLYLSSTENMHCPRVSISAARSVNELEGEPAGCGEVSGVGERKRSIIP
jgi:hypothetical protein